MDKGTIGEAIGQSYLVKKKKKKKTITKHKLGQTLAQETSCDFIFTSICAS